MGRSIVGRGGVSGGGGGEGEADAWADRTGQEDGGRVAVWIDGPVIR